MYWEDLDQIVSSALSINAEKKNSAIVIIPAKEQKGALEWYSKLVLGAEKVWKEVKGEKALQDETKKLKETNEANALAQFRGLYMKAKFLQGTAIRETALDPTKGQTFEEVLKKRLREVQKLVDVQYVSPEDYLSPLLGTRKSVPVRSLFNDVEIMTIVPFATRADLKAVIQKGVYEGIVGLVEGTLPEEDKFTGLEKVHFRENVVANEGDTIVTANYAQVLLQKIKDKRGVPPIYPPPKKPEGPGVLFPPTGGSPIGEPEKPKEEVEIIVADASDLYKQLSDKMTELLLDEIEARAEVTFAGIINGTVTAKNNDEIRSIVDLAQGCSKAAALLGAVKVTTKIFKKVK
jgi:hypothetical protein